MKITKVYCDICDCQKDKYSINKFKCYNYLGISSKKWDICNKCLDEIKARVRKED
jgi:hypothetical protein